MSKTNKKRTKCEVYSRVVGYIRPITQWNEGKQAEWDVCPERCINTFQKRIRYSTGEMQSLQEFQV